MDAAKIGRLIADEVASASGPRNPSPVGGGGDAVSPGSTVSNLVQEQLQHHQQRQHRKSHQLEDEEQESR